MVAFAASQYSDSDEDDQDSGAPTTVMRAADLSPVRRRIFDVAARHMRLLVIAEGAYADAIQLDQLAVAAWFAALKYLQHHFGYKGSTPPTHNEINLLKKRSHQVKGDFKTVSCDVILGKKGYDFQTDGSPAAVAHNRKLVTDLLANNFYLYRDSMHREIPGTLFEHPSLQEVINGVFYNDGTNSEAVLSPEYFQNGVTLKALAYVANTLECAIMEYQTGIRIKSRMTAKIWQPKFEKHLKTLQDWSVYTTNSGSELTKKLQLRMVQKACDHAKVNITPEGIEVSGLSAADFEANEP
ncbi:hypothetical protein C8R44DRAFT_858496 [Mycena epipterygia]|nr:hypothetical protein C8R44DRAFT_858496 [Mycena epipterygia]